VTALTVVADLKRTPFRFSPADNLWHEPDVIVHRV